MHNSKFLETEKGRIHYKIPEEVEKPLVLFVHGASKQSQHTEFWNSILEIMDRYCAPVRMDNFGHGLTTFEGTPNIDDKVFAVEEMVKHLRSEFADKELFLVGRSLGGYIVSSVVSQERFVDEIAGIGLIAPATRNHAKQLLKDWKKPVSVLWHVKDPAVSFNGFSHIKEAVPHVRLFTIGEFEHATAHVPETQPTHAPELVAPQAFDLFLRDLTEGEK